MKKLSSIIILIFILLVLTISVHGESNTLLYYKDGAYSLAHAVLVLNNDYYLDAETVAPALGMSYSINNSDNSIFIKFNGMIGSFLISNMPLNTSEINSNTRLLPVYINNKLYFPFKFLEYFYGLTIKYNNNLGMLWVLDKSKIPGSSHSTYSNDLGNYSIILNDNFGVDIGGSDYDYQGSPVSVEDRDGLFTAVISFDRLDEISIKAMREYYGDYTSSDYDIFKKIAAYRESYFRAMQEYYSKEFMFNRNAYSSSGTYMKIFGTYDEKIFGEQSRAFLYNLFKYENGNTTMEETHITLIIPVFSSKTIYSIDFKLKKGELEQKAIERITQIINSINISGLPGQTDILNLFSDSKALSLANAGIFPKVSPDTAEYTVYTNSYSGYSISYPSSFIPFMQNNLINGFDYKSYIIDQNTYFDIYVEPMSKDVDPVNERIKLLNQQFAGKINITDSGTISLGSKQYRYVEYNVEDNGNTVFAIEYYITNGSSLFTLKLDSRLSPPSSDLTAVFYKILESLAFTGQDARVPEQSSDIIKYSDNDLGLTFSFPGTWHMTQNNSPEYKGFTLKNPDFSGPIDINIYESKLEESESIDEIIKAFSSVNSPAEAKIYGAYILPYKDMPARLLSISYHVDNGVVYINRLVNYLDANNRVRLCHIRDIISDNKIYSLFVTASDYITSIGRISNENLSLAVNRIFSSFSLSSSSETGNEANYENSLNAAAEHYFKENYGQALTLTSLKFLNPEQSLAIAAVDNITNSSYYLLSITATPSGDMSDIKIKVIDILNKNDIIYSSLQELIRRYKGKTLLNILADHNNMTVSVLYNDNINSDPVNASYNIIIDCRNGKLLYRLERLPSSSSLNDRCEAFIENYVYNGVKLYFGKNPKLEEIQKNTHHVMVFSESSNAKGYFILSTNDSNESFSMLQFIPLDLVWDRLKNIYAVSGEGYTPVDYMLGENDKFEITVFLLSGNGTFKTEKYEISLDDEGRDFILNKR